MVPSPDRVDGDDRPTAPTGFWSYVSQIVDRFDQLVPFALFPLLMTLLDGQRVRRALDPAPGARSINVEFAFPSPLIDLWALATPPEAAPNPSSGMGSGGLDMTVDAPIPVDVVGPADAVVFTVVIILALLVYALVFAAIQAVYIGGLDRRLRGEPFAPGTLVVRYAPRFFVYGLVVFGAALAMLPVALISPGLLLLAIPLVLVGGYLFYAAPFLFVVEDTGVVDAFRRSYGYAVDSEGYFGFALWHLAVTAVGSLGLSLLVNGGPAGFLLALAVATPFSLALTAATVAFLQDLSPRASSDRRTVAPR